MSAGGSNNSFIPVKIKKEPIQNNGIDNVVRLSSFSLPRDLTLGGAGSALRGQRGNSSKKVYTPNLNATRNKNVNVKTSKDTSSRGRNRHDRGKTERGRGRGGRGALVQTTGLFSEGVGAELIRRPSSSSYRSSSATESEDSYMKKPTLVKKEGKIDIIAENQHIKDILGETEDDDLVDNINLEYIPVKLSEAKWRILETEKIEDDIKIKKEITDAGSESVADKLNHLRVKTECNADISTYPLCLEEIFSSTQSQLFLFQLPDSLPCQDSENTNNDKTNKGDDSNSEDVPVSSTTLKELEEGLIGKVIRYRSGKHKLVLGSTHFDLELGMETGFLQDVVSIGTNREERSGNMINLGSIQVKLTAIPDWEYLFKKS